MEEHSEDEGAMCYDPCHSSAVNTEQSFSISVH